jgi:hypothetical protein
VTVSSVRASSDSSSQPRFTQEATANALAPGFRVADTQTSVVEDRSPNDKLEISCKLDPPVGHRRRASTGQNSSSSSLFRILRTPDASDWWANHWVEILPEAVEKTLRAGAAKYSINRWDGVNKPSSVLFWTTIGLFDESREAGAQTFRKLVMACVSQMTHRLERRLWSEIYRAQQVDFYVSYRKVTLESHIWKRLGFFHVRVLRSLSHHTFVNLLSRTGFARSTILAGGTWADSASLKGIS